MHSPELWLLTSLSAVEHGHPERHAIRVEHRDTEPTLLLWEPVTCGNTLALIRCSEVGMAEEHLKCGPSRLLGPFVVPWALSSQPPRSPAWQRSCSARLCRVPRTR